MSDAGLAAESGLCLFEAMTILSGPSLKNLDIQDLFQVRTNIFHSVKNGNQTLYFDVGLYSQNKMFSKVYVRRANREGFHVGAGMELC